MELLALGFLEIKCFYIKLTESKIGRNCKLIKEVIQKLIGGVTLKVSNNNLQLQALPGGCCLCAEFEECNSSAMNQKDDV